MRNEATSGTRAWAIATLVLSILYLPLTGFGLSQLPQSPVNATGQGTILLIATIVQVLVALGFLIGSIAVIRGQHWGRALLMHSSAAALVTIAVGVAIQFMIKDDPSYLKAMHDLIVQKMPPGNKLPADSIDQMIGLQVRIGFYGGLIMGAIQAVYCTLLYRHMSSAQDISPVPAQ